MSAKSATPTPTSGPAPTVKPWALDLASIEEVVKSFDLNQGPAVVESFSSSIALDTSSMRNCPVYSDRTAFEGKFAEEIEGIEVMDEVIRAGHEFISTIYCYRSIARAVPMINVENDPRKQEVHRQEFDLLRPEIDKLQKFKEFQEKAIEIFVQNMRRYLDARLGVMSEQHKLYLVQMIDMLTILNAIKDMKSSLQNDFARYKRVFNSIRGQLDDADQLADEILRIQAFLGNLNAISSELRKEIQKTANYEDYLIPLMDYCADCIENKQYVLPEEGHAFYRVLLQLIYLFDSSVQKGTNVFKNKKINLNSRIKRILVHMPVIPLYADMQMSAEFSLLSCTHFDRDRMLNDWVQKSKRQHEYSLPNHRKEIRDQYTAYSAQFASLVNLVRGCQKNPKFLENIPMVQQVSKNCLDTVILGFNYMSRWSGRVREQAAWKYCYGVNKTEYERQKEAVDAKLSSKEEKKNELGGDPSEYEKVIRFNYSDDELYALIDCIGMIKGLGSLMLKAESLIAPMLRLRIHEETEDFVINHLARPLRKAHKRKRSTTKDTMLQMREFLADWPDGKEQTEDYLSKKKEIQKMDKQLTQKAVAPSLTQILLLRRMMHTIFDDSNPGMKGGFLGRDADLKSEWLHEWKDFYNRSFYYRYLLDYRGVLKSLTDMSYLWFREFHLELTKCVQFPIDMSLPWLLTDFVLRTPSLITNIFFAVDIWSDCAERALSDLNQQFLFDEVEAEVNLAFDQLIFNVAKQMFVYAKNLASQLMLDKGYKAQLQHLYKNTKFEVDNKRFRTLMEQRHVQILGRSIDFQALVSQHVNRYLRDNIDYALSRFEASDLTAVVELDALIENIRLTHEIMDEYLTLDPFVEMFREMNESVTLGAFRGRIVIHVIRELSVDFLADFVWNSATRRFVRPPKRHYNAKFERAPMPRHMAPYFLYGGIRAGFNKAFSTAFRLTRTFFGGPHVEALFNLLSLGDIQLIIDNCIQNVELEIDSVLVPYTVSLFNAIPPMKLPSSQFGAVGAYTFYDLKLNSINKYESLRSGVFQKLREIGNSLAFVYLLEIYLQQQDFFEFQIQSYFRGIATTKSGKKKDGEESKESEDSEAALASEGSGEGAFVRPDTSPFAAVVKDSVSKLSEIDPEAHARLQPMIENVSHFDTNFFQQGQTSYFAAAVHRVALSLHKTGVDQDWSGITSGNGLLEIASPRDFARFWSVMQFLLCVQTSEELHRQSPTDMEVFGESMIWAGCTILHLLGQRNRFEMFDFSYYLLKLHELDQEKKDQEETKKKKKKKGGDPEAEMRPFCEAHQRSATHVRNLNNFAFSLLEAHYEMPTRHIQIFHPSGADPEWEKDVFSSSAS